jgi:glucose dehydrogenase
MPSYDSYLYAIRPDSGELAWKVQTQGQVHGTVAVGEGLAYVAGCDGIFRALRLEDGSEAFQVPIGSYTAASAVLDGERAYFGTYDPAEVVALDLAAREIVWRYAHPDRSFPFYSSGALAEGLLVLGGRDRFVHAIDVATGEARWTHETRARVDSSPAVADGRVYVGGGDNRFYVLDLETGRELWEFDAGAGFTASPAIASGRVVIGATDGVIYCFG